MPVGQVSRPPRARWDRRGEQLAGHRVGQVGHATPLSVIVSRSESGERQGDAVEDVVLGRDDLQVLAEAGVAFGPLDDS